MHSKLPHVGNTIFSTMSALAVQHSAINLGQGFADYQMDEALCNLVHKYMLDGHNQYAPMPGVQALREAITQKIKLCYHTSINEQQQITITPGGTYGIYNALTTIIQQSDEVIVLEPAYDSYVPNIILNGGVPILIPLNDQSFAPDWQRVKDAITSKTKAIIINTPHNPTGYCFSDDDWQALIDIVLQHQLFVISDEVYEHIVLDGKQHHSILCYPQLWPYCFAVFSFGKVYHNTGWKLGYVVANDTLTSEFRKVHQYLAFSCNTPAQYALAEYLQNPDHYLQLPIFFERKRDILLEALAGSKFTIPVRSAGSFFQLLSYSDISDENDLAFCKRLTTDYGVTAIPVSAFYQKALDQKLIRLCFAKKDETLLQAAERLAQVV